MTDRTRFLILLLILTAIVIALLWIQPGPFKVAT